MRHENRQKMRRHEMKINKTLYVKQHGCRAYREFCKGNRVVTNMNTGTRTMNTEKTYSRKGKHRSDWMKEDP